MKEFLLSAMTSLVALAGYTQTGKLIVCGRWERFQDTVLTHQGNTAPSVFVHEKHLKSDLNNHQTEYRLVIRQDSFHLSIPMAKPMRYARFNGLWLSEDDRLLGGTLILVRPDDSLHFTIREGMPLAIRSNNPLVEFQFRLACAGSQPLDFGPANTLALRLERGLALVNARSAIADAIGRDFAGQREGYGHALCLVNHRYQLLATLCQVLNYHATFDTLASIPDNLPEKLADAFATFLELPDKRMILDSPHYLSFLFYYHSAMGTLDARLGGFNHDHHLQLANHGVQRVLAFPSPFVRDQLLLQYFKNSRNVRLLNKQAIPLLQEAKQYVQDEAILDRLRAFGSNLAGGERVPDLKFFDQQGQSVGFGDFPGKVILAHFWYRGCVPCATLSRELHPIVERYRDHPDVVFLNVNVDRASGKWVAGLADGKYHSAAEITLHTGAEGMSHPFLRHYGLKSVPQVVLADRKGNLVSLRTYKGTDESEGEVLGRLIADLLN